MDLNFVVDSSDSICDDVTNIATCTNWETLRRFVRRIVNDMLTGENDVRVAVVELKSSVWIKLLHSI